MTPNQCRKEQTRQKFIKHLTHDGLDPEPGHSPSSGGGDGGGGGNGSDPGQTTQEESWEAKQLRLRAVLLMMVWQDRGYGDEDHPGWNEAAQWEAIHPQGTECVAFLSWVLSKAGFPMDEVGDNPDQTWYSTVGSGWSTPTTSVEASFPLWTGGLDMLDDGQTNSFPSRRHGTAYEETDFAGNLQPGDWVYAAHNNGFDKDGNQKVDWDHVMMVVDVDKSGQIWLGDLYNHRFLYDVDNKQATREGGELGPVDRFIGIHMPYEAAFQ